MQDMINWTERATQMEMDLTSDPEALREYLEAMTRIIMRLAEIS